MRRPNRTNSSNYTHTYIYTPNAIYLNFIASLRSAPFSFSFRFFFVLILLIVYTSNAVDFYLFVCCLYHTHRHFTTIEIYCRIWNLTLSYAYAHTQYKRQTNIVQYCVIYRERKIYHHVFFILSFHRYISMEILRRFCQKNQCMICIHKTYGVDNGRGDLQSLNEIDTLKFLQWKFSELLKELETIGLFKVRNWWRIFTTEHIWWIYLHQKWKSKITVIKRKKEKWSFHLYGNVGWINKGMTGIRFTSIYTVHQRIIAHMRTLSEYINILLTTTNSFCRLANICNIVYS